MKAYIAFPIYVYTMYVMCYNVCYTFYVYTMYVISSF